ncbi:hypothetical protein FOL47_007909 [Perkinsus chesapeaki]|uniref:Uncharacterized protein n=1 Tax=Perkinsus chesapeaki TaxID=330153 RepID=A0A7J6LH31_PERCH|nr:hypothetical protein FOL47_007909 [Perkinsus chesapeaki]
MRHSSLAVDTVDAAKRRSCLRRLCSTLLSPPLTARMCNPDRNRSRYCHSNTLINNCCCQSLSTMMLRLLILIGGTCDLVCGQGAVPLGYYSHKIGNYFNYIFIQTPDELSGQLEVQWVRIVFNVVKFTYDEATGLINLASSTFPNDDKSFPYVLYRWRLKYDKTTKEIRLYAPEGEVSFVKKTRRLRNPSHHETTTTTTTTTTPHPTYPTPHRTCTSPKHDKLTNGTSSAIYFFDDTLNGEFRTNRHVHIRFERMKYIRSEASINRTQDIIPDWPSLLEYPYVDFNFRLLYDIDDEAAIMVGEDESHTVFAPSNCH